jgi:glycosyltransferase involved in cell wall biosynthesis
MWWERQRTATTEMPTMVYFTDDRVAGRYVLNRRLPPNDVVNLHWVPGYVDFGAFLSGFPRLSPFVWTLHDMNPFTGGCHYALGCARFLSACGVCPQLGSLDPQDLSARIHRRKAVAFAHLAPETTRIVTPSQWLAREARASSLFARFDVDVVPYGLDTGTFMPRDKNSARQLFGLPEDDLVIAFAATSLASHHKGFDLLEAALTSLQASRRLTVLALGRKSQEFGSLNRVIEAGHIDDERLMSLAYSAADIFVLPTRTDNLPNVVIEAMACGLPVVSFDVGGVPDMVRNGETGLLVAPENVAELRDAIQALCSDDEMRQRLSLQCRATVENEYASAIQANRYNVIYQELIDASQYCVRGPRMNKGSR